MGTLGWCIMHTLRQKAISECHRILQQPNRKKQVFGTSLVKHIQLQFRRENATTTSHDEKFALRTVSPNDFKNLVMEQFLDGKCYNLIDKVVATPEVLLTAYERLGLNSKTKLDDVIARATSDGIDSLWLIATSRQLREGKFDVESCCFEMVPLRVKGESLVVPNLKLKVVMEAVRMALEAVYEPRFVTFAYGGRIGMGRHTALRYIKTNIVNPTWWFTVAFHNCKFDSERVQKLISIMENKIEDAFLIDLICRFFRANVLAIEFGGFFFGRGFPQETNLCSILINIYFHGFDKEVKHMRRIIDQTNPVTRYRKKQDDPASSSTPREHMFNDVSMTEPSSSLKLWVHDQLLQRTPEGLPVIFHNPIKVYACRYLDEILVASSGSKELTMDLRNRVVEFLECELKLKVNKSMTALHSSVSETVEFLGMEIQAVTLSKLRPPMSDKAIRAWKKLIIRRQARALEKRNFRETMLKKAGMKILGHVLNKFKRSGLRNPDIPIAPQIRSNFRIWAREVINGFLQSSEEHRFWHRHFSSSEFLSNSAIREQLPRELVNAYDDFQEKVDQYFNTDKANKTEDSERKIIAEQKKYAQECVKDLAKLCIKIDAPMELVRKSLRLAKLMNSMGRPQPVKLLIPLEDEEIIRWYSGLAMRWLNFFCCCNNFKMVKTVVNYHLRFSCILTLAEKHESTKRDAIRHYTKDLKLTDLDGGAEIFFPLENKIKMMGDQHLADPKPVDGLLCMALIRRPFDGLSTRCSALCCNRIDTVAYRIRLLQSRRNINPLDKKKWVPGLGTIHEAFDKKCLPLCAEHMKYLYSGRITLQDIDFTFLHMN